ncbi:MAG: glycosyl transferase [Betaproteobacteria bacterium HGW-Betaproteobacteria-12]|nr:MAG: glycosyl transferase [Betaproteobacteria bacterium HGW-Betaproteobacteria-12]
MAFVSLLVQGVFFAVVAYFALYVLLELRVVLISRQVERRQLSAIEPALPAADGDDFPLVSVLLPVCNESAVVERLIDAVCRLRYPAARLEILVLDDSTDKTSQLAAARVAHHTAAGVDIRLLTRASRQGFKAGNLVNGISHSHGEFFAIFDADFIPPEDFLLRTIPCFRDPRLGFLQTGIGYVNRDASFLTKFQAMEMGHQQFLTVGLSADGDMASLSGSSCVWRRACVDAIGGWSAATVTEDVDLGYRAQISDWKYAYLRDVVSLSELPESISAFRVQRERWGRGLIHSAFKHFGRMWQQPMPVLKRLHAISMMLSSLLLAAIHVLLLLSLPLVLFASLDSPLLRWGAVGFSVLVAVWSIGNAIGARAGGRFGQARNVVGTLIDLYAYVALFLPMAWYYFVGGVRAARGVSGEFNRTPKGHDERPAGQPRINGLLMLGEGLSFAYSAVAVIAGLLRGNWLLVPLNVTACVGFGMVLYWSWREGAAKHA